MGLGKNLKELIALKGMNVNELAVKSGVSPQTLYAIIKRDNNKIDTQILMKIAVALDVPSENILSFNERFEIPNRDSLDYIIGNTESAAAIGILADLQELNDEGKREAAKRVNELTEIPRYTKPDTPIKFTRESNGYNQARHDATQKPDTPIEFTRENNGYDQARYDTTQKPTSEPYF